MIHGSNIQPESHVCSREVHGVVTTSPTRGPFCKMGWPPVLGDPTAFVIALTRSHRAWPGERRRSEGINSFCMLIASLDEERLWLCLYRSQNLPNAPFWSISSGYWPSLSGWALCLGFMVVAKCGFIHTQLRNYKNAEHAVPRPDKQPPSNVGSCPYYPGQNLALLYGGAEPVFTH